LFGRKKRKKRERGGERKERGILFVCADQSLGSTASHLKRKEKKLEKNTTAKFI